MKQTTVTEIEAHVAAVREQMAGKNFELNPNSFGWHARCLLCRDSFTESGGATVQTLIDHAEWHADHQKVTLLVCKRLEGDSSMTRHTYWVTRREARETSKELIAKKDEGWLGYIVVTDSYKGTFKWTPRKGWTKVS